jgi:hypothetical protein
LEELSSEVLEEFLLLFGLSSNDSVKVIPEILRPQTEIVLHVRPSLLINKFFTPTISLADSFALWAA